MVLTVEERPSSTRLSRWVWVSVSISSLVCSSVLLSIRAKHLHRYTMTKVTHLSATKMSASLRPVVRATRFNQNQEHSDVDKATVWLANLSLPVQELENEVFKLSCSKTQILVYLRGPNRSRRLLHLRHGVWIMAALELDLLQIKQTHSSTLGNVLFVIVSHSLRSISLSC